MDRELPPRESPLWQDWLVFLRSYKVVIEKINQDLAERGLLPLIEYSVLFWLRHADGHRLRQVDLARGVLVSKSRVTRLMNGLVENGYVRRQKDLVDKRVTYAVLTDKGLQALEEATPTFTEAFYRYFVAYLGEARHGDLARLLFSMATQDEDDEFIERYMRQTFELANQPT